VPQGSKSTTRRHTPFGQFEFLSLVLLGSFAASSAAEAPLMRANQEAAPGSQVDATADKGQLGDPADTRVFTNSPNSIGSR